MSRAMPRLRHSKLIDGEADVNRVGGWSRKRIVRMVERFVAAVRQAHPAAETGEGQQGVAKPLYDTRSGPGDVWS